MTVPLSNTLLDALPAAEQTALSAHLEPVALPQGLVLFEARRTPRYVHFLSSGMASIVTPMRDGTAVEVGVVGREGMVEVLHLLGPNLGSTRCMIQVAGSGFRIRFSTFQEQFLKHEAMRLTLIFAQYQGHLLSQIAACNRCHKIEERLARWLLMVEDRVSSPTFALTQDFLANMLGSSRPAVAASAGKLQRSGLIRYQRGAIEIIDRAGLELAACECYPITKRLLRELHGSRRST